MVWDIDWKGRMVENAWLKIAKNMHVSCKFLCEDSCATLTKLFRMLNSLKLHECNANIDLHLSLGWDGMYSCTAATPGKVRALEDRMKLSCDRPTIWTKCGNSASLVTEYPARMITGRFNTGPARIQDASLALSTQCTIWCMYWSSILLLLREFLPHARCLYIYCTPTPSRNPMGIKAAATLPTPLSVANRLNWAAAFRVSWISTLIPRLLIYCLVFGLIGRISFPSPRISRSKAFN